MGGAAQLVGSGLEPSRVLQDAAAQRNEYLYHAGIAWILDQKKSAFHEHSPTLHSVCQLPWLRIQQGMLKMYQGEVMDKWPIVQHLPFGTLLVWEETVAEDEQGDG